MIIVFVIALLFCIGAGTWDAVLSARGIRKGLFVEGNGWAVFVCGTNRPTLTQLLRFNAIFQGGLSIFALFGIVYGDDPLIFLSAVCLATHAVQHILAALKARKFGA